MPHWRASRGCSMKTSNASHAVRVNEADALPLSCKAYELRGPDGQLVSFIGRDRAERGIRSGTLELWHGPSARTCARGLMNEAAPFGTGLRAVSLSGRLCIGGMPGDRRFERPAVRPELSVAFIGTGGRSKRVPLMFLQTSVKRVPKEMCA